MSELTAPPGDDDLTAILSISRLFANALRGLQASRSCGSVQSTRCRIASIRTSPEGPHETDVAEQLLVTQPGPESME
jgi:hypothetical protein